MFYNLEEVYNTTEAKMNFMKGLIAVIKADQIIEESEEEFFYNFSKEFGLSERDINKLADLLASNDLDLSVDLQDYNQKIIFIKEALQLAYVDGIYHHHENEVIYALAEKLDLEKKVVRELEEWTSDGIKWYRKGLELFNLEDDFIKNL